MRIDPVTRGVVVIACGLWLAGTSPAAAQTASAGPPAPPQEEHRQTGPSTPAAPPVVQSPESLAADILGLPRFRLDPGFAVGVPVGAFGDNVGASFGGAIDFGVGLGETPVSIGAAFDYLRYGTETRHVALFPALPDVVSDVSTTNNIFRAHALMRVQPRTGRLRPYAEGLMGFAYAYTSTSADLGDSAGASTTHLGDFAPSVGGGGGVTILLISGPVSGRDAGLRVSLSLGLRYLMGGDVSYLTKGAIDRDEHGATFEATRSPLNMVSTQIGMAFEF